MKARLAVGRHRNDEIGAYEIDIRAIELGMKARLAVGRQRNDASIPGEGKTFFLFSKASKLAVGFTQPLLNGYRGQLPRG